MVRAAFIPFGELTDINMPLDAASQKHRGFCFVQFEEKVRPTSCLGSDQSRDAPPRSQLKLPSTLHTG